MRPKFSVIIPTYSRPDELRGCLEAISQLDYPVEKFEVIVVDDGSPEPVENIVEPFCSNLNLRLIAQTNAGPARARNRGATEARGEILAFTDDDCRPTPSWLTAMESTDLTADTAIGGRTINALENDPYAAASQMLVDYLYDTYERKSHRKQSTAGAFFTSNNVAFPREMFLAIGGFSSKFRHAAGEDREICDRWVASGGKLERCSPEATVMHYHSMGLSKFVKQHFTYGRGAYHYHRLKSRGTGSPLDDTSLEFYTGILTYPFASSNKSSTNAIVSTALLLVSQVANVSGFFFELSKKGRSANANANIAPPAYTQRKTGAGQALGTSAANEEPVRDFETVSKT